MFFGPKLPISTFEKVSIEMEFQRLLDVLGSDDLRQRRVFTPTDGLLDLTNVNTESEAEELKNRIAESFEIDHSAVELKFDLDQSEKSESQQGTHIVHVDQELLDDKTRLAVQLVSACSARRLIDIEIAVGDSSILMLEELLSVWHGFGPINAAAAMRASYYEHGGTSSWTMSKLGLLSGIQMGYAMAVREFILGNPIPPWHKQLHVDAKESFAKAFKYLNKTNDCLVSESNSVLGWNRSGCDAASKSPFASYRFAALRYLPFADQLLDQREVQWVLSALRDKDAFVRCEACELLEYCPETTEEIVRAIEIGMDDPDAAVRAAAVRASGIHGSEMQGLRYTLERALASDDRHLMMAAATSVAANDLCDAELLKVLLQKVQRALVRGSDEVENLISVLRHIHDSPKELVVDFFADDEDLRYVAETLFDETQTGTEDR